MFNPNLSDEMATLRQQEFEAWIKQEQFARAAAREAKKAAPNQPNLLARWITRLVAALSTSTSQPNVRRRSRKMQKSIPMVR